MAVTCAKTNGIAFKPYTTLRTRYARARPGVLARLECLPPEAIAPLLACATDPNASVRMNAAAALRCRTSSSVSAIMQQLVGDENLRVRLIAAGAILQADPSSAVGWDVVKEALGDSVPSVRQASQELVESLGHGQGPLGEILKERMRPGNLPAADGLVTAPEQPGPPPPWLVNQVAV